MAMDQTSTPPLSSLRAFVCAARHESLREAADTLGVTPSAISHQIRTLEEWIGAAVFVRADRQVRLTPLGRDLYRRLAAGFDTINGGLQKARANAQDRVLRVSALPLFTSVWLLQRLERFEAQAPGIAIEIDTNNTITDLTAGGIDVAIRNVQKPGAQLVARKLLDLKAVPLCTPEIAAQIRKPEDLARATLIHLSVGSNGWPQWLKAAGCPGLKPKSQLSLDTIPAALEAAARGRGVVLGLDPLIWDAPAAKCLAVPFKVPLQSAGTYYVVHRRADRTRHAVRLFTDWLVDEMKQDTRRLRTASRNANKMAGGAGP
jgi:LysR family transcriptional regulator, glycine cleavage system transcriptional activator